jgi:hypothetical protein
MLALFAEVMRWNTSCCGIEPSIMVIQVPMKVSHSQGSGAGKKSSLPAAAAWSITAVAPPPTFPLTTRR